MAVVIDPDLVLRRPFQQLRPEVSGTGSVVHDVVVVEVRRIASLVDPIGVAAVERFLDLEVVKMPQRSLSPNALECEALSAALVLKMALADRIVHQAQKVLVQEVVHEGHEARSAFVQELLTQKVLRPVPGRKDCL